MEAALRFLQLLGIDPAAAWFRNIRPGGRPNSRRGGRDLHGFNPAELIKDIEAGESLYLVTGTAEQATGKNQKGRLTGCVTDEDINGCNSLFAEWDDRPIAEQIAAWRDLNLPEPTVQNLTGGKSCHTFWALAEPMDPAEWRVLQSRLIAHCQSDAACKNPSRLMRLPGGTYFDKKTGKATGQAVIVHESGLRYTAAEMAAALPEAPVVAPVGHSAPMQASVSTRSTAGTLPPRGLDQIRLAAQCIPQRMPGASKDGGSRATGGYEPSRRALCGCSAALAEAGITDPDAVALDLLADRWPDRATAQQVLSSSSTRDPAAFWGIAAEYGHDTRRHDLKGSKPTAEEEAAEQDAAAAGFPVWTDKELAASLAAVQEDQERRQGFKVLGWDFERKVVFYRHRQTSQIASVKPYGPAELLKLASTDYWEKQHPRIAEKDGQKVVIGIAWTAAATWLIDQANRAGVFEPERVRGRGVWIDTGNRVVWHLGDRLEVDGKITRLADHQSPHNYGRLSALPINPAVAPLGDDHGQKILEVIKDMGWAGPCDYLHVAGHAVTSNVCGALEKRPGIQYESPFGSGKTDGLENVQAPLQAGIGRHTTGSTEAGIRQLIGKDALPATIDESEQEDGRKREAQLRLVRYAYDGKPVNKGTPSGQSMEFCLRSSLALAGINAPIPNPADRSRIAVVTRKPIPGDQWADVAARRAALITNEVGERLLRRSVTHLPALLANITTFGKVVAAMVTTGDSGRAGDTWGALLAGAHHLTSTAVVSEAQALEWIRSVGWDYSHTNSDDTDRAAGAEGRQCLDHLLAHELRWRTALDPEDNRPTTDTITIRELVAMVRSNARSDAGKEAINALGRKGIKVTIDGLVVAHNAPGTQAILSSSKWGNGAHRARLLELPGAAATASPVHFPTDTSRRAVLVPWAALDGQALQPPQATAAAPPKPAPVAVAVAPPPAPVTQYDWFPAAPPPQEWMEPFSRIAAKTPRPPAYKIASELAPDGRVKPAMVSGWLKWLDALVDEFAA